MHVPLAVVSLACSRLPIKPGPAERPRLIAGAETSAKFCLARPYAKKAARGRLSRRCVAFLPLATIASIGGVRADQRSGTGAAERGDGAAVLRPAGDVVADGNRAFLAVG